MRAQQFICIEGGEGSGKTAMSAVVTAWLRSCGRKVTEVYDPGSTPLAQKLREIVVGKDIPCTPEQQALLYVAARSALADEIKQLLASGHDVVCGRWTLSTMIYQGICGEVGVGKVNLLTEEFIHVNPDIYIVLDATPEIAIARKKADVGEDNLAKDRFDSRDMNWHYQIRDSYTQLARKNNYPVVNADQPLVVVAGAVVAICRENMGL